MSSKIIMKSVDEIIPYENNPRINDDAVEYVANSIREFGFKSPIIVDDSGVIIAGHTRLKAAKQLGLVEVPVIVADDLSEEQVKAYRLADNKTGELAEWDMDLLMVELDDIDIDMKEFGFEDLGFDEAVEEDEVDEISDIEVIIIEPENPSELEAQFNKLRKEGYKCRISTL